VVKQIIFHVGAPKTGSTYLQKRLKANDEILRENNIDYPVKPGFERMAANAKLITLGIDNSLASGFSRNFPNVDVSKLDPKKELDLLLGQCPDGIETVILSSEKMRPRHVKSLAPLIGKNLKCKIVLFIRKQDDWIDSYFNQLIKNNNIDNIEQALEKIMDPNMPRYCCPNWLAHVTEWQKYFDDVKVIFYDDKQRFFFDEFIKTLGFTSAVGFKNIPKANTSLSLNELAYLSGFPTNMPKQAFTKHRRASLRVAQKTTSKSEKVSFLSRRHRAYLIDLFAVNNDRLLEHLGVEENYLSINLAPKNFVDLDAIKNAKPYRLFSADVKRALAET